jgi:glutaconate CoA-transferase subunit A
VDHPPVDAQRAEPAHRGQLLGGPDPYFDDLFAAAAERAYVSCERVVPTEELAAVGGFCSLRIHRWMVHGVVAAPRGAHFTSCVPDYGRDEAFQRAYAQAAKDPGAWREFAGTYLRGSESDYQAAVAARRPLAEASA